MKPKKCPKCKATEDDINNAEDMCDLFGLGASERQNKRWMCGKCNYFFNDDEADFPVVEYNLEKMTLGQISGLISNNWNNMPEKAHCYIEAMSQIESINDPYGDYGSGVEIVSYFLANAREWRGEVARDVKKYLNSLIKRSIIRLKNMENKNQQLKRDRKYQPETEEEFTLEALGEALAEIKTEREQANNK